MEDQMYQTDADYSFEEITRIEQWFDRTIGTESEISENEGRYYFMGFEMNHQEVEKMRAFELRFREGKNG